MRQLNGPRAASSSGAGMKALSIVKNSATTADDHPCKLRLDRPSASGCRWKRGAEDDGRWRNLPVLASLGRICTVAGLYNGFQRSDESNGRMGCAAGRWAVRWGAATIELVFRIRGGGSTFGWPSRATERSKIPLRGLRRMALFIAKGGARGNRSQFWGPKWHVLLCALRA